MRRRVYWRPAVAGAPQATPKYVGVWLDQYKAQVVTVQGENTALDTINSDEERRLKGSTKSEISRSNRSLLETKRFFGELLHRVADADEILLAGPGEAKHEFKKEFLRRAPLSRKLADVYTDEKMTNRQLKAKVLKFFQDRRCEGLDSAANS